MSEQAKTIVVISADTTEALASAVVSRIEGGVREYCTIDKSSWGSGPWQTEIDKRQWIDAATGLPCLIVRNPGGGNLCGYVGVSKDHPAHGMDYYHYRYEEGAAPLTPIETAINDLRVHGGLTYVDGSGHGADESRGVCHVPEPGQPDDVWWFGFDCAHCEDFSPGYAKHWGSTWDSLNAPNGFGGRIEYRDVDYVAQECANLAKQIHALAA